MALVVVARGRRRDADARRRRAVDAVPRTRVNTTGEALACVAREVLDIHSRRDSRG